MTTTIEAGSLGSEHIGKTISVTWKRDLITSTVTDELVSVTHKGANVTLRFKRTRWYPTLILGSASDSGLTIAKESPITIEENNA